MGYDAWISAIRRDQTPTGRKAGIVQWDAKFNLVKVNPLLNWTKQDVWAFILEQRRAVQSAARPGLSQHRLLALHARRRGAGEDERAGRWAGLAKTECGLHTR